MLSPSGITTIAHQIGENTVFTLPGYSWHSSGTENCIDSEITLSCNACGPGVHLEGNTLIVSTTDPGDFRGSVTATWSNGVEAEPFQFLVKSENDSKRLLV